MFIFVLLISCVKPLDDKAKVTSKESTLVKENSKDGNKSDNNDKNNKNNKKCTNGNGKKSEETLQAYKDNKPVFVEEAVKKLELEASLCHKIKPPVKESLHKKKWRIIGVFTKVSKTFKRLLKKIKQKLNKKRSLS